jgi:4-hydroxybenzoate polyprenyltransferase
MSHPTRPSRRDVLRGYLVLPHAVPIIVVMIATAAFALVAASGWPGLGHMTWLLGAMFGAQLAIGAVNELVDVDLDAISKPEKPIPAGLVSRRGAWMVVITGLVLMTACSLRFSVPAFLVCGLGTGAGIAYSVWFKRTIWSWVPYLVALPLLPIWVWTALSSVEPGLFAIYPVGAAAVIAVQLAQSLPDIEADRIAHVRIAAAIMAASLAPWLTSRAVYVWLAAVFAWSLVGVNAAIWSRNGRTGAMACFPCIAAGAAAVGIGWTTALLGA